MLFFEQLCLIFSPPKTSRDQQDQAPPGLERDFALEAQAGERLRAVGAIQLIASLRVEWNGRMRSAAGRADFQHAKISLNPRLRDHGAEEIERTLLHELAHLLAHARAGHRRISPHGREWRKACHDLGIAGEERCHNLPFPRRTRARRFLYRCPSCALEFPRVRRIRRAIACLACCRRYSRGSYQEKFRLKLVWTRPRG